MNFFKTVALRNGAIRRFYFAAGLSIALSTAAHAEVKLDFWDQQWGPDSYSQSAKALVDEYNASQSDIKVTYRSVPWTNWYETYVTAISSGSAPDLSTGAGFMAAQFYSMDAIEPVDDLVKQMQADGSAADFLPGTIDSMKYKDHYVALPWQIDIRMIYYNKDLLAKKGIPVPKTWAEMQAAAKAATGGGTYGLVSAGDTNAVHWILASSINAGGGLFGADGKPALDSGPALDAAKFLGSFAANGSLNPASAGYSTDDARGSFLRGEAAFFLDGPGVTARAGDKAAMVGILDPITSPSGAKGTIYWVNNVMVYKQSKHPKETMKFLKWLSDHEVKLWSKGASCCIPVRQSFLKDAYFKDNTDINTAVAKYVPIAKPMSAPVGGTFPQLNAIDGDGFLASMGQQLWQGIDPAKAAAQAQAHLVELMAK